jgi:hypothetical protein
MTLLDRILLWFGYIRADAPRLYERVQNGTDAVARGQRWEAFFAEEDGLHDMITALRRDYFEKVGTLKSDDTAGLLALATADRIAREIERKVQAIIETGHIRANERAHVEKIASIRR